MANFPHPVSNTDECLKAIHDRLVEAAVGFAALQEVVQRIADNFPAPEPEPALVDLREPAKAPKKRKG